MPGRSLTSMVTGAFAGMIVPGAGTLAHVSARGTVDVPALLGLTALSVALTTTFAPRVCLTFGRVTAATVLAQPVIHKMIHGSEIRTQESMSGQMQHPMPIAATDMHGGLAMVMTHTTAAVVCAVALRWGLRWLRSMPAIARALILHTRGVVVPVTLRIDRRLPAQGAVVAPLATLASWDSRGPPR